MIRVLSISTLFPSPVRPAFGRFVANQMQAVAAHGDIALTMVNPIGLPPWPLSLAAPYRALRDTPAKSEEAGLGVLHPRFRPIPRFDAEANPARIARAVLPLALCLHRDAPFDLVDAQFFFPDGPAAAIVAQELGLPLTIKARGSDIHHWGARAGARDQMLDAARQAAGLLAVSEALRGDMAALGMPADGIAVHYTGLDRTRFQPAGRESARLASIDLGIPPEGPLLVAPGALIAIKGQRLAIAALCELPEAQLALAGSGPDAAALKALATGLGVARRVHILGQVSHDTLPLLLSAADAVVLPSEREGLANAWVEALACGAPLVIPDIGGAREVIRDASAGRIAAREPSAIAAAVRDLLADPPTQAEVAANAARFSWERNASELSAFWRRMAKR